MPPKQWKSSSSAEIRRQINEKEERSRRSRRKKSRQKRRKDYVRPNCPICQENEWTKKNPIVFPCNCMSGYHYLCLVRTIISPTHSRTMKCTVCLQVFTNPNISLRRRNDIWRYMEEGYPQTRRTFLINLSLAAIGFIISGMSNQSGGLLQYALSKLYILTGLWFTRDYFLYVQQYFEWRSGPPDYREREEIIIKGYNLVTDKLQPGPGSVYDPVPAELHLEAIERLRDLLSVRETDEMRLRDEYNSPIIEDAPNEAFVQYLLNLNDEDLEIVNHLFTELRNIQLEINSLRELYPGIENEL